MTFRWTVSIMAGVVSCRGKNRVRSEAVHHHGAANGPNGNRLAARIPAGRPCAGRQSQQAEPRTGVAASAARGACAPFVSIVR